jgi:hypothetical protein
MNMKNFSLVVGFFGLFMLSFTKIYAQCPFNPTVLGDTLLCTNETSVLTTQAYDSYQWNYRYFGSTTIEPITGANGPSLLVDTSLFLAYVSLDATLNGCTERSPEVFIDLYAFLPVTVQSSGEFYFVPNSDQFGLCAGDTIIMALGLPYTTNIQWSRNDVPIPGATNDTLIVTIPGAYRVTAAPAECPNLITALDVYIIVVAGTPANCTSSVDQPDVFKDLLVTCDDQHVQIQTPTDHLMSASLWHTTGQLVTTAEFRREGILDATNVPTGVYYVTITQGQQQITKKVFIN